jgi:rod shape-determining protein MreD
MRNFFIFFSLITLATLQLSWPEGLRFFHVKPDLLLVFTVSAVFYFDFKVALAAAVLAGLLKDTFLPAEQAINTVLFSIWSYAVFRLCRQISIENNYIRLAIILIVAVLNNIILGIHSLNSGNVIPAGIFLRNLIISSLYTGAVAPLIFKLNKKISA